MMNKRKVLVTGAGGFIGSHLTEALVERGARVRALVRYNARNDWGNLELVPAPVRASIEVTAGDVRDPYFVDRAVEGCTVIFHLSSLIAIPFSYEAPHSYVETNISGALNVFQAALRHKVKSVVHTSTSETYGTALYTPIDEKHPLQGQSPYSATKIAADKLAESYQRSFDLPVATVRPFNTYGPRQSARAVIPTIISQVLAKGRVELGALTPVRDLTYVTDTVDGFLRAAGNERCVGEVVNIGAGQGISIDDLAGRILALMKTDAPVSASSERMRPQASEVMNLLCDNRKAAALLGWAPKVTLDQGLLNTIEWIRTHLARYKPELYVR